MLTRRPHYSAGLALVEALIALAILASALLGILQMQLRTFADAESALRRAQALHLIDDLAERIRSNPDGFAQLGSYRSDWGAAAHPGVDCQEQFCGPNQLARWDLAQWKAEVALALPQGDATVFDPPDLPAGNAARMLAVLISWRIRNGDSFELAVPGPNCPTGHMCHLGHVQP